MVYIVDFFNPQVEWETPFISQSFDVISVLNLPTSAVKVRLLLRNTPNRREGWQKGLCYSQHLDGYFIVSVLLAHDV